MIKFKTHLKLWNAKNLIFRVQKKKKKERNLDWYTFLWQCSKIPMVGQLTNAVRGPESPPPAVQAGLPLTIMNGLGLQGQRAHWLKGSALAGTPLLPLAARRLGFACVWGFCFFLRWQQSNYRTARTQMGAASHQPLSPHFPHKAGKPKCPIRGNKRESKAKLSTQPSPRPSTEYTLS